MISELGLSTKRRSTRRRHSNTQVNEWL